MKTAKIVTAALAVALAVMFILFAGGLFLRLVVAGTQLARDMGDKVILTGEEEIGGGAFQTPETAAVATWPPGDDPSWSEEMPLYPVDKTADELAEEMEARGSGESAP